MTSLPVHLKTRILAAARARPSPTRQVVRINAAVLIAVTVDLVLMLLMALGMHVADRPFRLIAGSAVGWVCIGGAATWAALAGRSSMLGPSRARLLGVALGTPMALVLWTILSAQVLPALAAPTVAHGDPTCLGLTLALSVFPLLALMHVRRHTVLVHPGAAGAALGAAAGTWAGVLIDLFCPVGTVGHVVVAHVVPILLVAGVGACLGRVVLAVRRRL